MDKNKIIGICDKIIEWCFYSLIVTVTFSTSLVEIFASIMILSWCIRKIFDKDFSFIKFLPISLFGLFMLWNLLSCFNTGYAKESFRGMFKVIEYGMLFIVAATTLSGKNTWNKTIRIFLISSSIICLNGLYQYFSGAGLIRHRSMILCDNLNRISSSFVHPNDFGVYLLVILSVCVGILVFGKTTLKGKIGIGSAGTLAAVCLYMTKSRGSWLSFIIAFLILGAMKTKRVLAIFVAVLLVVFTMLPYTAQERVFSIAKVETGGTTWERLMLWKGTINMIKEHPVLGFGVNTYSRNFPKYKPAEYPDVRYTHNSYLHMASEIGIPGALLFLIFLITVLIFCFVAINQQGPGNLNALAIGLFAGAAGFAVNSMVDTHLYSVNLSVFFYLLLGYCSALCRHENKEYST
jgi:O-antigen ligase